MGCAGTVGKRTSVLLYTHELPALRENLQCQREVGAREVPGSHKFKAITVRSASLRFRTNQCQDWGVGAHQDRGVASFGGVDERHERPDVRIETGSSAELGRLTVKVDSLRGQWTNRRASEDALLLQLISESSNTSRNSTPILGSSLVVTVVVTGGSAESLWLTVALS